MSTILAALALMAATSPGLLVTPAELATWKASGGVLESGPSAKVRLKPDATSAAAPFVARHLGYDARMHDGSIEDWTHKKLSARAGR